MLQTIWWFKWLEKQLDTLGQAPSPRLDWTDAVLETSFMCKLEMVSKLGGSTIGAIFGNGKPSIILSIVEGMMGMVRYYQY